MTNRIPLIGLAGRARSGKDTVAGFILAATGGYRYSFADPIRAMLKAIGVDLDDPYWLERKEDPIPILGASPRRLMQTLGTEWGRQQIHPNIWLLLAQQQLVIRGPGMVVTDIRFENEADWVRERGGKIIHVIRDDAPLVQTHSSEIGVARGKYDALLYNTGTLAELQLATQELLRVYQT